MGRIDPITFQVIKTGLMGVVREMELLLFRTGYSTAIRESHDASCAILDRQGRLIAQYESLATHMAIFQVSMNALFHNYPIAEIEEDDAFILNHPYQGCSTHVSDMAVITPILHQKRVVAFCASVAHKTDIGGAVPGSASGSATEIFQEGLLLPPVKYVSRGKQSQEIEQVLRANSRTPDVLAGDIRGQIGVCRIGEARIQELMDKYGEDRILDCFEDLMDSTEQRVRAGIRQWHDGRAEMEAFLDPDGIVVHKPVRLHLAVTKEGDSILFNFSGCDDQINAPVNLKPAAAMSAVYFALIAMIDPTLPNNDGLGRAIQTRFRPGSVVSPEPPAAVSCYTVTLGMVREIVVAAMAEIAHQKAIACNGGLPVVTIGGKSLMTGKTYIQYEIGGAGCGAVDGDDGPPGMLGCGGLPGTSGLFPWRSWSRNSLAASCATNSYQILAAQGSSEAGRLGSRTIWSWMMRRGWACGPICMSSPPGE